MLPLTRMARPVAVVDVSLGGQRAASTEILLDGVENADNYDAYVGLAVPLDSVAQYRVITNGFDAQYGRASGGVVNLVTQKRHQLLPWLAVRVQPRF